MANFRQYKTPTGKIVLLGKSAETNEELINQTEKNQVFFHTSKPGSPFATLISEETPTEKEIYETATMCAKHSQDWRDNKKDVLIHIFLKKDIFKKKSMPLGTFGIKKFKEILVKKSDILQFEKNQK